MQPTFEKRLRRKPARSRLGFNPNKRRHNGVDLRQRLVKKRVLDARSVLGTNVRLNTAVKKRKMKTFVRKSNARLSNQNISRKFTRNLNKIARRIPLRRNRVGVIPDLLSLSIAPPVFQTQLGHTRIYPTGIQSNIHARNNMLSPIQGFRLSVRNLQPSVTLDDIYELFSNVGSLRLCTLVRPGNAEVVFNELSDAKEAILRYHNRELDGRPMNVSFITLVTEDVRGPVASRLGPRVEPSWNSIQPEPLTTSALQEGKKHTVEVDADVIRRALFNVSTGPASSRRPVDFNVSLR